MIDEMQDMIDKQETTISEQETIIGEQLAELEILRKRIKELEK